ncbi:hypothetical protein U0X36_26015 [Bacillus thuringiensis]|uniref:Uncharacterized protein n=1 Tax=Bacillus cereus (strain VD146) TaxID=1053236 RepID=R8MDY9_BACCX|nr:MULTISPECIES: hypothetical protein [Bacillus cereus group]EOP32322.1 hypothetical protein IK1_05858 [Bacillus cereus VD146]MDZ3956271.1 hypothetical protein [Bacillus thuringiensis]RGP42664.1 hypothetical protein BTW32_30720 [Bacillus thuringiensis]
MIVQIKGNEKFISLLNKWYHLMIQQQLIPASQLKKEIDEQVNNIEEDQDLLLYYSLLDFRYKVLTDALNINPTSFEKVDSLQSPTDNFLAYYYHFFKAIHATLLTNNNEAIEHYEQAEKLLQYVPDEREQAEFNYRVASFYLHTYQPLEAIKHVMKAKEFFIKSPGYENNTAACDNILGAACIDIKQFPQAEESFNSAINILNKQNEEKLILKVRSNLGLLYASQNLSSLAIRHLSEVNQKIHNQFRTLFLEAREHFKLGESSVAEELIKRGLDICNTIENKEYTHHFTILDRLNKDVSVENLEETILKGIDYFNKEQLYNHTQEYTNVLAVKFYEDGNHSKASKYFYLSHEAKGKKFEKGALK